MNSSQPKPVTVLPSCNLGINPQHIYTSVTGKLPEYNAFINMNHCSVSGSLLAAVSRHGAAAGTKAHRGAMIHTNVKGKSAQPFGWLGEGTRGI